MQILPPTVAAFQTLNEDKNASQLFAKRVPIIWQRNGIQVADGARRADFEARVARDEGIPTQRCQIDQAAQARLLRGNSHVPPASQASPSRQSGASASSPLLR
ncbi:hypothetical protein [Nonomuraea turcica]|uniref:hypothetical protein n=1 Tax=Nonomuraea sp. G32 TaxID=3067274 RepID=UPI00273C95F9|nr:hypothetical protein [Nonomuraea sp. G32]MDP4501621.1 hypothetical protein [Nonomuraea sp. G32]